MFTKEEYEERRKFIGASEAAAVLGLSRWGTPMSVWADKTGKTPIPTEESFCQWYGTEVEEIIAKRFTKETGKKVHRVNEPFVHKKHPFLRCSIDRKVVGEDAILQAKTVTPYKSKEWTDNEVPQEYIIQEIHELACSGYKRAYIAVAIGNLDFKIKVIDRDDKMIQDVISREVDFWNNFVVPDIMPTGMIKANDDSTLYELYPKEIPDTGIEFDDETNKKIESLQALKEDKKVLDSHIKQTENEIKAVLKDTEAGKSALWVVTWKEQKRASYVVPESKTRVMRITKNKQGESK